jgi:hypothetical protein
MLATPKDLKKKERGVAFNVHLATPPKLLCAPRVEKLGRIVE